MKVMRSIGRDNAIKLAKSKWWEKLSPKEIVGFQLFVSELAMDFSAFHKALEKALGRGVWTHELAYVEQLQAEFLGEKPAPSMDEILSLVPADKRIVVVL